MIALLWLACADPAPTAEAPADGPVSVRVALESPLGDAGGALIVQVAYDPAGKVDLPTPEAQGLTFAPDGAPTVERIGGRDVVRQRFAFRGPKGSYEIAPVTVSWRAPAPAGPGEPPPPVTASSKAVFVDLGVEPPRPAEIVDIVEPGRVRTIPWLPFAGVLALFVAGVAYAFRPRAAALPPPPPPVPPDVAALAAWDALRDDPARSLEEKSVGLAELFRVYVEAVLGFEATARTTAEVLDHLGGLAHLPPGNVQRAKAILRATDRVKFAEDHPGAVAEWLAALDADLRGFVESTRPVSLPRRKA